MLSIPLILVAGGLPTLISGLPVPSFFSGIIETVKNTHFIGGRESATSYAVFGGNGETSDGWPAQSDWVSDFDTMFEANQGVMSSSCTQWGVADNTDDEISEISTAIQSVASSTGIDPRFILAIIMQESNGCVRAPTTNYGVRNPGLMQSHNGAGTCNDATVSDPCPMSEITQMITDGTAGTSSGDGLKQCLTESGTSDVSMYYKAARIYNSGSIDSSGNLGAGIATHCYASDVANRLIGWASGPSSCSSTTIETLTTSESFVSGSSGSSGSSDSSSVAVAATTTSEAAPASTTSAEPETSAAASSVSGGAFIQSVTSATPEPTTVAVSTTTSSSAPVATATVVPIAVTTSATPQQPATTASPEPASTTAAPQPATTTISPPAASSSSATPSSSASPYGPYPGAIAGCQELYTVQAGDYCDLVDQKFNISLDQLVSWNSGLDYACSNLWLGYQYCVKA